MIGHRAWGARALLAIRWIEDLLEVSQRLLEIAADRETCEHVEVELQQELIPVAPTIASTLRIECIDRERTAAEPLQRRDRRRPSA